MSAEHPQHDTPSPDQQQAPEEELPKHPFTRALETWDAWSIANTMRTALQKAREQGDQETLARFARYPQWTQGPGPLEALRANREVVQTMSGWQWQAMRGPASVATAGGRSARRSALTVSRPSATTWNGSTGSGTSASATPTWRGCWPMTLAGGGWPSQRRRPRRAGAAGPGL